MYTLELDQPATPAPKARTARTPKVALAVVTAAIAAVIVAATAVPHRQAWAHTMPRATAADAARACKTAIEDDTQARVAYVNRTAARGVFLTFNGVDTDEAVPTGGGWTVNGTEHFAVNSILGAMPGAQLVVCTATPAAGGTLSTVVDNR